MPSGLLALLDDVAALAKVAAASLDDVGVTAAHASVKAAGIVIDDAAVTPRYVVGLTADRELPIIKRIAVGSLKNKLVYLLPGALALGYLLPKAITPLLMAGGAYLCLEGWHKIAELFHDAIDDDGQAQQAYENAADLENDLVTSAVRTDLILSAEIMAITLGSVSDSGTWTQATVLALVGIGMTALVYGAVALIVKADDAGIALARTSNGGLKALGRALVKGMPKFLSALSFIGTLAMLWVGGGIIIHGLHEFGVHAPEDLRHKAGQAAGPWLEWLTEALLSGIFGVVIGAIVNQLTPRKA